MSHPAPQYVVGKEHALAAQVQILLNIVHTLEGALSGGTEYSSQPKASLDGGARSSLETTLIHTCGRLDSILEEKKNWGVEAQDEVFDAIIATHKAQTEFLISQKLSADEIRRPSFQLRPNIVRAEVGFAAIYGDISTPNGHIIGVGKTPEEALLDFDAAFKRPPSQHLSLAPHVKSKKK